MSLLDDLTIICKKFLGDQKGVPFHPDDYPVKRDYVRIPTEDESINFQWWFRGGSPYLVVGLHFEDEDECKNIRLFNSFKRKYQWELENKVFPGEKIDWDKPTKEGNVRGIIELKKDRRSEYIDWAVVAMKKLIEFAEPRLKDLD
jgi:hypothetical protein